jgi:hypothetical protein
MGNEINARASVEAISVNTKKLFIGLPIYGQVDPFFWQSTMKLVKEFGNEVSIFPRVGDSLIPRARNSITAMFLRSDCTHLLFIDSDIIFSADHIRRIMSHDEDIVGGFYPLKRDGSFQLCCNTLDGNPGTLPSGLNPMKYMGSGFLLIARYVLEKIIEVHGKEIEYAPDHARQEKEWDFWRVGVYNFKNGSAPRYLSEDWYLCQTALDLGFKVWGDSRIALKHSGHAIYPLSYQEKEFFGRAEQSPSESPCQADSPPLHGELLHK